MLDNIFDLAEKDSDRVYVLTPPQIEMYIEHKRNPDSIMYNCAICFSCKKGDLDLQKLSAAIKKTVNNHAAFQVRIDDSEEIPVMKVTEHFQLDIPVIETDDLVREKKQLIRPFDLKNENLIRCYILLCKEECEILFDIHHIIIDGISLRDIVLKEIADVYEGRDIVPEKVSQLDLAVAQKYLEQTEEYEKAGQYYKEYLSTYEKPVSMIEDFEDHPTVRNHPTGICEVSVRDEYNGTSLKKWAKDRRLSAATMFLAAQQYSYARFAGTDQALTLLATHGRYQQEMADSVGMMVATVPVYTKISDEETVMEYLKGIRTDLKNGMKNSICSLLKISEDHDISDSVIFGYEGKIISDWHIRGCVLSMKYLPWDTTSDKLNILVFEEKEGYTVRATYRADLYCAEHIRAYLDTWENVLSEFMTKTYISEIEMTTPKQRKKLEKINATESVYEQNKTVVDLFREKVREYPDNIAVVFQDKKVTYKELDEITDRLAEYIASRGIGREDVVSVLIPRNEQIVIASLGILKSGAAYQPLDASYPKDRLEFMVKDAGAKLLITDEELGSLLTGYQGERFLINEIENLRKKNLILPEPEPGDLFILLYTSGTTGTPKGCMLEHRNIVHFCHWYRENYSLTEASRVAAYASYGFDANMMDLYPALTTGAAVFIIGEDIRLDLVQLNEYFKENKITHSFMTTQVGRQFAMETDSEYLQHLSIGGEKLVPLYPDRNFHFWNLYGPTECTILTTAFPVEKEYLRVPIGKSLYNTKLYVADKHGKLLPPCMPGELWVAGHGVSRGYLNRPEQTEKVYIENPFCEEEGYRTIYRTGDIVRMLPDGTIDFIGRNDGQVKIRGFRIELSEVEKVIREFPGIKDATVAAFDEPGGGKYLAAYIVADEKIDTGALNRYILENKPPYMVPKATMQIDRIPLNVNQKVDKKKLPPVRFAAESSEQEQETREYTRLEKELSEFVEGIIGHREFTVSQNLLYAGLTSISVIKLAMIIQKKYGVALDTKALMKSCVILDMEDTIIEQLLQKKDDENINKKLTENKKEPQKESYPLSKSQLGVYLDCMRHPGSLNYNISSALQMGKDVDSVKLAEAVKTVLKAHPSLFVTFLNGENEVVQIPEQYKEVEVPIKEISESEIEECKKRFVKPFNLSSAPLFRVNIVKTEEHIYLLTDFHHIIFDGTSMSLFYCQLKQAYEGQKTDPEQYTSFDYVEDEIRKISSDAFKETKQYIKDLLKDYESVSEIPADRQGNTDEGRKKTISRSVDLEKIKVFAGQIGVNASHVFLAASFYVISRFINSRNVYINTISSGRSDLNLSDSFGMFVKTIPLAICVEDISVKEFVRNSGKAFQNAINHELYPYTDLAAAYGYKPEIMFEYQMDVIDKVIIGNEQAKMQMIDIGETKFKLAIHIEETDGKPALALYYNDSLYSDELMHTLLSAIACTLSAMIANPEGRIRNISMLSAEQKKQQKEFSAVAELDENRIEVKLLHEMFEKQAEKTPDRMAVIACDRRLTYRELDRLSNIAAHELMYRGLKKGDRVLLLLDRTSAFFTSMLAVLKAGGTFIPICTDYPKERIESILEDSEAAFVITEERLLDTYENTIYHQELLKGTDDSKPHTAISPEDLAYLIYTSGSTGKPKGVMLRHIGIANYLTYSKENIQIKAIVDKGHVYGSVTTIAFDMAFKEHMAALCHGLTFVFADEEQTMNPMALAKLFKENKVDVFNATPSRLLQFIELEEFMSIMKKCRVILSGGEKYPLKLLQILQKETNAMIINTYGPTEITVSSNAKDLTQASQITIGKPLMNYEEYIVDEDDNFLPPGVVGELIICGVGVAKGYNKLPEQTRKAFGLFCGKRAYRSGDYAKWTLDGEVIILGRKDNQVKLRGLRIELGEIEKSMTQITGIKSAVVLIRKVGNKDAICAYYVADRELDVAEIKSEISKTLTDYMIPSAFVWMKEMPLTPNGKVNMKELPEPVIELKEGQEAKNKTEQMICDIFAEILEVEKIYADSNFFEMGGTSLTATRVVIEAAKKNLAVTYNDVFEYPTAQKMACFLNGDADDQESWMNIDAFDYTRINQVLAENTLETFRQGEPQKLGDVLLTGCVGFLGIHILNELLEHQSGKVYCLLRGKETRTAADRMEIMYYYYFEKSIQHSYRDRVTIIDGDITNKQSFEKLKDIHPDTVINCAANVKHFSKGTDIEDVNYYGTLNILEYCKKAKARLIHVSTMSVGGFFTGKPGKTDHLKETELYIGQEQGSKYTASKFLAERAILSEVADGFNAKIMRVGNLAPRERDGEYQINFATNSFMGRLRATCLIGSYPYDTIRTPFELSPIDSVAKAIILLAQTPKKCTVFHPYNNNVLLMGNLYSEMNCLGLHAKAVEREIYEQDFERAKSNKEKVKVLSSMIAYQDMAHGRKIYNVGKSNNYTLDVLYRLGFLWPVTSERYMRQFLQVLKGLGFFEYTLTEK